MDDLSTAHPPDHLLRAFGLGQLEAAEAEKVAEHLGGCRDCSETMAGLADDTFVSLVRKTPEAVSSPQAEFQATLDSQSGVIGQVVTLAKLPDELRSHPRYEIVELIGRGGMGDVYKAQHKLMNRTVALKVIRPELVRNASAVDRFRREVQAAARLHHGNIVTAYDAEQAGDLHFLVMEFVDGIDLSQVVQERGPLPVAEACNYIRQAAAGLEHAHRLGMVHRDIKPHNLMLTEGQTSSLPTEAPRKQNAYPTIKILDFGLANLAREVVAEEARDQATDNAGGTLHSFQQLTQMGTMMGTPDYIAPEQAADARTADIRSDIYSLGCTLTFLLTGKPLFAGASVSDKLKAHAEQRPPKLTDIRGDIPPQLQQVVDRMLAKDPSQRFQIPSEVADALAPFIRTAAGPPRKRILRSVLAAAAAFLLAGVIYITTDKGRIEFRTDVDDVNIVVSQGGREIRTIDLSTGSEVAWLPSGDYTISLKQDRNDVQITPTGFTLSRWGKQIVSLSRLPAAAVAVDQEHRQAELPAGAMSETVFTGYNGGFEVTKSGLPVSWSFYTARTVPNGDFDIVMDKTEFKEGEQSLKFVVRQCEPTGGRLSPGFFAEYHTNLSPPGPFDTLPGETYKISFWAKNAGSEFIFKARGVSAKEGDKGTIITSKETFREWRRFECTYTIPPKAQMRLRLELNVVQPGTFWIDDIQIVRINDKTLGTIRPQRELQLGHEIRRFTGHEGPVRTAVFFPDGKQILSASGYPFGDSTMRLWDVDSGQEIRRFTDDGLTWVMRAALSPAGSQALSASWDGLRLWDVETGKVIHKLEGHTGEIPNQPVVQAVAFSSDGKRALSGANDRTVRLWDLETGQQLQVFEKHDDHVTAVLFAADGEHVISAGLDGDKTVRFWSIETGKEVYRLPGYEKGITSLVLSPDATQLLTGGGDGVRLWDLTTRELLRHIRLEEDGDVGAAFLPDGRHILSGGQDGTTRIWDLKTGKELQRIAEGLEWIWNIAVAPDGRTAVTCGGSRIINGQWEKGNDFAIRLWQLPESVWPQTTSLSDQDRLRGKWAAVGAIMGGKTVPREQLEFFAFEFDGEQARIPSGKPGQPLAVRFKIDASKDPAQIDFLNPDPAAMTPLTHGICKLDGDRLRMTLIDGTLPRPADWAIIPPPLSLIVVDLAKGPADYSAERDTESKKLGTTAALEWLGLLDAGDYGASWETMATSVKSLLTRDQALAASEKNIKPLGKTESRVLRSVEVTGPINDRKSEVVVVTFETRFANGGTQRERVTLIGDVDGQWRVAGHGVSPAPPSADEGIKSGVNLIVDPSLESTAVGERYPNGWGTGNLIPKDAYKHQVVEGGRTSQRGWMIEGDGQYAVVPTNRPVADRTFRYAAQAWVKIESGAAQIKLLYFDAAGKYLGENRGVVSYQQDGWHRLTMIDDLARFPTATKLSLAPTLIGKGKAVFDDLEMLAFEADKLPERFETEYDGVVSNTAALFDRWVGRWDSTTVYKPTVPTAKEQTVKGRIVVHKILDDRFLLWQWFGEGTGEQYISILGWDEYAGGYHIWLFGSGGEAYERIGTWDAASQSLSLALKPPAAGVSGSSTDRFVSDDRIESTLQVKANGQVTRDMHATWLRRSSTVSTNIDVSSGPVAESDELAVLYKMAGEWTIKQTMKPSIWFPDGRTETISERADWSIGGRFLMFRSYNDQQKMKTLALMTWDERDKSYRYWHFASDVAGGQWRITWDASSRGFHWRSVDMPAGWIGTGYNRWIDDDTFDNQALIKDEDGRILFDSTQDKRRMK